MPQTSQAPSTRVFEDEIVLAFIENGSSLAAQAVATRDALKDLAHGRCRGPSAA
ncbi:MAG: hypothetical protein U0Q14_00615 [Dermatophilaceae bacterium]